MIVTQLHEPFPVTQFRQEHERSDGVHLSQVIKDLDEALNPDRYKNDWDLNAAAQLGVFWEMALERAYREMFAIDIGEVELDGIIGTPDGLGKDEDGLCLEEYKCTWLSCKKSPLDVFYYKTQGMGYCKMTGIHRMKWRILHVMGDYRGSGPVYNVWDVRFEPEEVDENWEMLVNHARHREWL